METNWTSQEEATIAHIMLTETQHDPECEGCKSCDDTPKESCHRLCDRQEAIRRMTRRTETGRYKVSSYDSAIYARELKRWPKAVLQQRAIELGLPAAA